MGAEGRGPVSFDLASAAPAGQRVSKWLSVSGLGVRESERAALGNETLAAHEPGAALVRKGAASPL